MLIETVTKSPANSMEFVCKDGNKNPIRILITIYGEIYEISSPYSYELTVTKRVIGVETTKQFLAGEIPNKFAGL